MNDVHDLEAYNLSKHVCKDFPKILKILDSFEQKLYSYERYYYVAAVIQTVKTSKSFMKLFLDKYTAIKHAKGLLREK